MAAIYDEYSNKAIQLVKEFIDKYGPRVSGTKGNLDAANELEAIVGKTCSQTVREKLVIYPNSLFSIGRIFSISYLIGLAAVLSNNKIIILIGFLIMLLGVIFCVSQFILYSDIFDKLFKGVEGNNIIGYLEPKQEAQEQIIIVGHHDSSYIYPFHERLPKLFPFRLFTPIVLYIAEFLILVLSIFNIWQSMLWSSLILVIGLVFVAPMFWYISRKPGPGAGDNLIGCAIGISIMEIFYKQNLNNTRLVLLLSDGEEVGQKGSHDFVTKNLKLLRDIKTKVISIDSIYAMDHITLLSSDRNGFSKLSEKLNKELEVIFLEKGCKAKIQPMPFGGGGTDAGQFARKGVESASIIGMSTSTFRSEILIHTSKDMPERINRDAVGCVIEIVSEYIKKNDMRLN